MLDGIGGRAVVDCRRSTGENVLVGGYKSRPMIHVHHMTYILLKLQHVRRLWLASDCPEPLLSGHHLTVVPRYQLVNSQHSQIELNPPVAAP